MAFDRFSFLNFLAGLAQLFGILVILSGILLLIVSSTQDTGMFAQLGRAGMVGVGLSAMLSGVLLTLFGGSVEVLIAIARSVRKENGPDVSSRP